MTIPLINVVNSSTPAYQPVEYKQNLDFFWDWRTFHRKHQQEALQALRNETEGQVCLPTGTGKTRLQVDVHIQNMIEGLKCSKHGVYVISAHRLVLCSQLLEEFIEIAVQSGIPFDTLFVGSGQEDDIYAKFKNVGFNKYVNEATRTTQSSGVKDAVENAFRKNRHVLGVTTYHSFDRLNSLEKIDCCTYDEAHVTIADDFLSNIKLIRPKIKKNFFFTATRRVQGETEGMNNEEIFGKILYQISPRHMIEAGEIVPPKIHIIQTAQEGDYTNHTMLIRSVVDGFNQHKLLVKKHSANPEGIGAKILITTTGNKELMELHNDELFRNFCEYNNIQIFAFSAERGTFANFSPESRNKVLDRMRALADHEDAIMLHIDILTEGIDLPSITGVMPFRELNTLKLMQTIGRSARLIREDRRRLYQGEIQPAQWDHYIKPCCWVILPEFFKSLGNAEAMKNTIRTIVNTYEIPVEEWNVVEKYLSDGQNKLDRITEVDKSKRRKDRESELLHIIEEVMNERLATIGPEKLLNGLSDYLSKKPAAEIKEAENALDLLKKMFSKG